MTAKWSKFLFPLMMFVLVACSAPESAPPVAVPAATETATAIPAAMPTEAQTPTPTPASAAVLTNTTTPLSFTPALYRDESAGFELDYPAEWTLDPSSQVGVRGGQALLLSPGTSAEAIAEGGTRVSIVTYLWDPKNDLDAWVTQRKTAWEASGFTTTREEIWQLADGRAAAIFVLETPELASFTLLTTIGDDYLQLTGEGDLALVEAIARTLRPAGS
jgi:hypothetical protein